MRSSAGSVLATLDPTRLKLDADGHLHPAEDWSAEVGAALAAEAGLQPLDEVLAIAQCMRGFVAEFGTEPTHRAFAGYIARQLGDEAAGSIRLALLFPQGLLRQASLVAGLPKPKRCL